MTPSLVRFGEFEIDLRMRELKKGSTSVRLQDQPFHILSMMLERPGDVVTREDIRLRLWPDGTSVDFEHSVNAAVKRLRNALGDDADCPRYVETLPRRGYRLIAPLDTVDVTLASTGSAVIRTRPRLVVLPFTNLTGDVERDYLSDGFTEEMIAQLGRRCADSIGVLARTSSMLYKNVGRGAGEIGEALRADYLVEGSIRLSGDRVRITAQLIETRGETHLWAESYDRQLADCLVVQMEVASEIARALAQEILPPESDACCTRNPAAYEAYLAGRFHWNKPGDAGLVEAIERYDAALQLDPRFSKAHAARARAFLSMAEYYRMDPIEALRTARAAAERALAIDPRDSDAYVAIAETRRVLDWDWHGARAAFQKALSINPNSESAHRYYALFLTAHPPGAEALATADRAYDLDPLCLAMIVCGATVRYFGRDYEGALTRSRQVVTMAPEYEAGRRVAAASLVELGRFDEAIGLFEEVPERSLSPVSLLWKGHALAESGRVDRARELLARLDRLRKSRFVSDYHLALVHAALSDTDAALTLLERASTHRDPWLEAMSIEPRFDRLRSEPRFAAIVTRLQLHAG